MTSVQAVPFEEYRRLLIAKRADILSQLQKKPDALAQTGRVAHEDHAGLSNDEYIMVRVNGINYQQLKLVDAALNRLDSGDYGTCVECGEDISPKRLRAIPWAIRCVACQERHTSGPALAGRAA